MIDSYGLYKSIKLDQRYLGNAEKYSKDLNEIKRQLDMMESMLLEQTKSCPKIRKYMQDFLPTYDVVYSPGVMGDGQGHVLNGLADYEQSKLTIPLYRGEDAFHQVDFLTGIELLGHEVRHLMSRNHDKRDKSGAWQRFGYARDPKVERDAERFGADVKYYFEDPLWVIEGGQYDLMCECSK